MVQVNGPAPSFEAKAYYNNDFPTISLKDYKDKWVVLFFYPKDFTFVCPTELGELADRYEQIKGLGAEVLSVSTDTPEVHKAWHDASETIKKITYPMLSDPTGIISKAYGVYIHEEGIALRGTFVIDPDGVLQAMEVHNDGIGRSADELIRKLQAAQFVREHGEVCPAGWHPGDKTLKPGVDLVGKL